MAVSPPADGFEDDGWEPVPCPSLRDAIAECIDPLTRQRSKEIANRILAIMREWNPDDVARAVNLLGGAE